MCQIEASASTCMGEKRTGLRLSGTENRYSTRVATARMQASAAQVCATRRRANVTGS